MKNIIKNAVFDKTRKYRYLLYREWDKTLPRILFIMLNPSDADEILDDKTISRCIYFAKKFKFGSVEIVNLYSLVSKNPKVLKITNMDPVGKETDKYILQASKRAKKIVVAWGTGHFFNNRNIVVKNILIENGFEIFCLKKSKYGHPYHPSRLENNINELVKY